MKTQVYHRSGSLYCGVTLLAVICLVLFRLLPGSPFGVYAMTDDRRYHERNSIYTKCSFFDTVNVTGYPVFPNGSYYYNGTIIPRDHVGTFDFIYEDLVDRVEVAPHVRACICKLKPCINICCPWGEIFLQQRCEKDMSMVQWPEPQMNVTMLDGSVQRVNIFEQFVVQSFRPCTAMFSLLPELNSFDSYQLFENGTLLREEDMYYNHKNEFCLVPSKVNDSDLIYTLSPANCAKSNETTTVRIINGFAMLFSIPFMLLTIAVYLLIPELRNQHGKSLVCYLAGLSVGYSALCSVLLYSNFDPDGMPCKVVGYTAYFFFMSAFLWLNVISFDLWHNFRGTRGINRFQEKKRFLFYSLYSWGFALIFLIFTVIAQEYTSWPKNIKPGIGGGEFCWLDMTQWSAMLYFFGPILIIIVVNTVMFVMTAFKIHGVQREMARIIAREDSTRNLRTEKDKFGLFLRLFLIMGVTWSSEIISYIVGNDKQWSRVFYVSDLCNAMQGFLIFMLFVLKKKVKQLISNRLSKKKSTTTTNGSTQSNSTSSTSTDINTHTDKFKMKSQQGNNNGMRPPGLTERAVAINNHTAAKP